MPGLTMVGAPPMDGTGMRTMSKCLNIIGVPCQKTSDPLVSL